MFHPLSVAGGLVLPTYVVITIALGILTRDRGAGANAFLNASRSLPLWVAALSFLAANCGALEVVGLSALAAQYGAFAFHFYWIGAIPAMIFLSLWMLPIYMRSEINSVPEYLARRFGERLRRIVALILALSMLLLAGVSLYAMAQVLQVVLAVPFLVGGLCSAAIVTLYVTLGGVRATIYAEIVQLILIVAGLLPLATRVAHRGDLRVASNSLRMHLWRGMPPLGQHSPADGSAVVLGLGFVLSFSYWCTDFVLMQRALAARTEREARLVPLCAGFGKLAFSFIVVLPGMAAYRLFPGLGRSYRFDQALPLMMRTLYGPTMLGVGLTALAASLMSGLAANISGFAAAFTQEIYRSWWAQGRSESHYLLVGKLVTVLAVAAGVAGSYASFQFSNVMVHIQLIFSLLSAPLWAIFVLGMTSRRVTERAALWALASGTVCAAACAVAGSRGRLHSGSQMASNFVAATLGFAAAITVGLLFQANTSSQALPSGARECDLWVKWNVAWREEPRWLALGLSLFLLLVCIALNLVWW